LRKLLETHYEKFRYNSIQDLCNGIKLAKQNKDAEEKRLMDEFLNLCAVQIQSKWRGLNYRKFHLPALKS